MPDAKKTKFTNFTAIPNEAFDLDPYSFKVYACIAKYQNSDTDFFQSLQTIADKAVMSKMQVRRSLSILKSKGFVQCTKRPSKSDIYKAVSVFPKNSQRVLTEHASVFSQNTYKEKNIKKTYKDINRACAREIEKDKGIKAEDRKTEYKKTEEPKYVDPRKVQNYIGWRLRSVVTDESGNTGSPVEDFLFKAFIPEEFLYNPEFLKSFFDTLKQERTVIRKKDLLQNRRFLPGLMYKYYEKWNQNLDLIA